jgi:hypothetical protein
MVSETDYENYEKKISQYDCDNLLNLWMSIEAGNTPGWAPGKAFEYLVLRAFQLEGAEVRWPYSVRIDGGEIEQIDGVVYFFFLLFLLIKLFFLKEKFGYSDGLACLIECKDESKEVNVDPIAKLRNQLLRRPGAAIGIIFSRSGFTKPAVTLAKFVAPQTILLWPGDEVDYALRRRYMRKGLVAKFRYCIEYGFPDYDIKMEDVS